MTIEFCINCEATFNRNKVMPKIIAKLNDNGILEKEHSNWFVKIDVNKNQLKPGVVGIWNYNSDYEFDENVDCTGQYDLVEIIRPDNSFTRFNGTDYYRYCRSLRGSLYSGISVETESSFESRYVFLVISEDIQSMTGVVFPRHFVEHDGYVLTIKRDIESSRFEVRSLSRQDLLAIDSKMGEYRHFLMLSQTIVSDKSFSIVDETVLMQFLFEKYKTRQKHARRTRVTSKPVESLVSLGKITFSEFAKDYGNDLQYVLNDPLFAEEFSNFINDIDSDQQILEAILLENPQFKKSCCEMVKKEVLESKELQKESIVREISSLSRTKVELESQISATSIHKDELLKQIENLQTNKIFLDKSIGEVKEEVEVVRREAAEERDRIIRETKEFEEERERIKAEVEKIKLLFKEDLIKDSVLVGLSQLIEDHDRRLINSIQIRRESEAVVKDVSSPVISIIRESQPSESLFTTRSNLDKHLKKVIMKLTRDCDSVSELTQFMISSVSSIGRIVVCGDSKGIVADIISSSIDSRLADIVLVDNSSLGKVIDIINRNEGRVIRIQGAFSTLDCNLFFALCKFTEKILIFESDDVELLKAAPSEVWSYASFLNVNVIDFKRGSIEHYTEYIPDEKETSVDEDSDDYQSILNLLNDGIISQSQAGLLNSLRSEITHADVFENEYFEDYVEMIAHSNGKDYKRNTRAV